MLNQEEFTITEAVLDQIKNSPEMYDFHLDMFKSLEYNPILMWTYETLKKHENLWLTLAIEEKTQEFSVNSYYHLLQLATQYEDVNLNWPEALEIAKETLNELFIKYNNKKISF